MQKLIKYLMNFLCLLIMTTTIPFTANTIKASENYQVYEIENKPKRQLKIQKGAFLNAINQREISTQTADEGDIVTFLNPQTMYIDDEIVLPASAIFVGEITTVREPVQGTNGVLKINIFKVIFPDNTEYPMDGYVGNKDDQIIGGEMTAPLYYDKVPHYPSGWKRGVLQFCPTNVYHYGKHTVIKTGKEVTILLRQDFCL